MKYKVTLGRTCPIDSTLCINDKEYLIETNAWNIISIAFWNVPTKQQDQKLLQYIYENFDGDLIINPTDKAEKYFEMATANTKLTRPTVCADECLILMRDFATQEIEEFASIWKDYRGHWDGYWSVARVYEQLKKLGKIDTKEGMHKQI